MKGQTLIEILVALSVTLILLTITTVTIITALNNAQGTKNRNEASRAGEQGIELVRQMRDSDWPALYALSGTHCMANTCTRLVGTVGAVCGLRTGAGCGKNYGEFSRQVLLERNASACNQGGGAPQVNNVRATVTVSWSDGSCSSSNDLCRQVNHVACFANLYSDPTL